MFMRPTTLVATLIALLAAAGGCQTDALRPWQQMDLPTHDRQLAFQAAKEVIGKHFEIASSSWTQGTIESRPQMFEGKKSGTLADFRGAGGGRWRRTVSFELTASTSDVVGIADVRLQREVTDQAMAAARTGGYEEGASGRPQSEPYARAETGRSGEQVWVDAGHDDALARELLSEIVETIARDAKREAPPAISTPRQDVEESGKFGDAPRP